MSIVQAESDFLVDMGMAKDIAETLHAHYPGHLWAVNVTGGIATIKALNISSQYGYVLKYAAIKGDAGSRKKDVLRAGGEILERAQLERGAYTGQMAQKVDGIKNYNPVRI